MHKQSVTNFLTVGTSQPRISDSESSISVHQRKLRKDLRHRTDLNYTPVSLRWPILASLFVIICGVLALLEYIRRSVPPTQDPRDIPQTTKLTARMLLAKSRIEPFYVATPRPKVNNRLTLPKGLLKPRPVSYPTIRPRQYPFTNETIPPTVNRTEVTTNISNPEIPSAPESDVVPASLACRDACHLPSEGYIDIRSGPIIHATAHCIWEPRPPGVLEMVSKKPFILCARNVTRWITGDTSACPYQTYNYGDTNIAWTPEQSQPGSDWFVWVSTSEPGNCDDFGEAERSCSSSPRCRGRVSKHTRPAVTQVFRVLEDITSTVQIAGFESSVTSVFTGNNGHVTTFIQTTSVSGTLSTFTTSRPVAFVTVTKFDGDQIWTEISRTTIENSSSQPSADALPPGITNHPITMTLRNQFGTPTGTTTEYLETLVNSDGVPIATAIADLKTLTDSKGQPTKTIAEFSPIETNQSLTSSNNTGVVSYIGVSQNMYFATLFLPVLLSIILSILIQLVDKNIKIMLPFYALARLNGATAANSICMIPGGLAHLPQSFRLLRLGEPISFLGDLLLILSSLLVSISSEAIKLKLYGACEVVTRSQASEGCYLSLVIDDAPSRVGEALMALMAIAVALIWIFRSRLRSGIASNPWSLATSSSLLSEKTAKLIRSIRLHNREKYISNSQMLRTLEGKLFALQYYQGSQGGVKYGIDVLENGESSDRKKSLPKSERVDANSGNVFKYIWERCASYSGVRGILLAILCGLLILILYYDLKQMEPSEDPFESFMDSQKFGVRFLFSALGVVISFLWDSIFCRIAMRQPYKYLSKHNCSHNATLSMSPAFTVFEALWRAILQRDLFAFTISFASTLSKFTPLLLSTIPYYRTQTWKMHITCAWITVSVLAFMILVLLWSFFESLYMPVDPNTIAGNMYYICDSAVLNDFEGMSTIDGKERNALIKHLGRRYQFGEMVGISGELRIGIKEATKKQDP